ncbi:ATP-binding protein [Pigmentibacter sp. JX0631]|uniref:ATP-binding protein n=1 Tax=Pigmentibacter sp. JX0631 TaxID=2976982 RepID=UPI002468835C|nr:ATP-binding protein [Pigmentibacter sp. JX0631]WGL60025.1 ATP-binding protein [Pigmentibacter sp. JX0631]
MKFIVPKNRTEILAFLNSIEKIFDIDKNKIANLRFVLEELLTNSLKHSQSNLQPLEIYIEFTNEKFSIEYNDYSEIFDIFSHYSENQNLCTDIDDMQEGGLGIFLIFNLIRNYEFHYDPKQIKNTMKFNV